MTWKVELSAQAQKNLKQLDPQITRRILAFLHSRVAELEDPRSIGEALKGSKLVEFWKYRVGDYRIIYAIDDGERVLTILRIAHRREAYR